MQQLIFSAHTKGRLLTGALFYEFLFDVIALGTTKAPFFLKERIGMSILHDGHSITRGRFIEESHQNKGLQLLVPHRVSSKNNIAAHSSLRKGER